jgi:hypothetical protein
VYGYVKVTSGPHRGAKGFVAELIDPGDDPVFAVQTAPGTGIVVPVSRMEGIAPPPRMLRMGRR